MHRHLVPFRRPPARPRPVSVCRAGGGPTGTTARFPDAPGTGARFTRTRWITNRSTTAHPTLPTPTTATPTTALVGDVHLGDDELDDELDDDAEEQPAVPAPFRRPQSPSAGGPA